MVLSVYTLQDTCIHSNLYQYLSLLVNLQVTMRFRGHDLTNQIAGFVTAITIAS